MSEGLGSRERMLIETTSFDYIKNNFSKDTYNWAIEKVDVILKKLGL
jgi:hypothetical protein